MPYRKDIIALRAFSVIIIILFHSFPGFLPNGYIGVDIFFVISGFLMTEIILSQIIRVKFSFVDFYTRRIKRIFPTAIIVLWVVALFGGFTLFDQEFDQLRVHLKASSMFYSNILLANETNYFDVNSQYKPLLNFWSLAVEVQFYIWWPAYVYIVHNIIRIELKQKTALFFIIMTGVIFVSSLCIFLFEPITSYYSTIHRAWEFLAGCSASIFVYHKLYFKKITESVLFLIFAILLIVFALASNEFKISTCAAVFGAVCFLMSDSKNHLSIFLHSWPVLLVGEMSYSLYLWHWPALSFYRIFKNNISTIEILTLIFVSIIFSFLTYFYIEQPIKKQNWNLSYKKNLLKIVTCFGLMFVLFYCSQFFKLQDKVIIHAKSTYNIKNNLKTVYCSSKSKDIKQLRIKWCKDEISTKSVWGVSIGDSHALKLFEGLLDIDSNINWKLIAESSCPPFILLGTNEKCFEIEKKIMNEIMINDELRIVVMSMSQRVYRKNMILFEKTSVTDSIDIQIKELIKAGKTVIIVKPVPEIADNINNCVNQRFSFVKMFEHIEECRIKLSIWVNLSQKYVNLLNDLKIKNPKILLVDPNDVICDNFYCSVIRNQQILYSDKHHLSLAGAKLVARQILDVLLKIDK